MTTSAIQLVAGLANPGKKYAESRHNAGSWFIQALLKQEQLPDLKTEAKFYGSIAPWMTVEGKCWLFVPCTYMNESGSAIQAIAKFYRIPSTAILIVHDDLDLLPGVARYKKGGGEGGHNGLKDIACHLQTKDFWRLRIGIGHPGHRDKVHDYVLSPPSREDQQKIALSISHALDTLLFFIQGDQQKAMQALHNTEK